MKNRWGLALDDNPGPTPVKPPVPKPTPAPTPAPAPTPPSAPCKDTAANACTILRKDNIWVKNTKCGRLNIRRACPRTCMQCNAGTSKSNCCIADYRHSNGSCSNVVCRNKVIRKDKFCRKTWDLICANQAAKKICVNLCV